MDRNGRLPYWILLVLLSLILFGCGGDDDGVLLRDRFGDPGSGWGIESSDMLDRGYQDGEYFIEVYEPNWLAWAHPGAQLQDVSMEIEAQRVSGSPDGHFGLLCRYRGPGDFYYFAVTGDGYYAILRVEDGASEVLTDDGFVPSSAVSADGEVNQLRVVCQGEQLTFYVNGEEVAKVTDDAFQRGDVGLAVGSGPDGSIRVHFDNLIVSEPAEHRGEGEEE